MSDILLITTYQSFEWFNSSQTEVMLRVENVILVHIRYQIKAYELVGS